MVGSNKHVVNAFNNLSHNEIFGSGKFFSVDRNIPTLMFLLKSIYSSKARLETVSFLKQNQWPYSIWIMNGLSLHNKISLIIVMYLAKIFKRARYHIRHVLGGA